MTPRFHSPRARRLPALLLLLLAALFAVTGCSTVKGMFHHDKKDRYEGVPVTELYTKAHRQMENGNWNGAALVFKRLIAQYPYGPYTEQALVESAYAQYKSGSNDDAISTIDRFIRTYPTHRNTVYMYYLRGLVDSNRDTVFLQRVWKLDASRRDLATPLQAYDDFKTVVEHYPNSRYAADAKVRMTNLRDLFADHELETALYYLRRGADVAAVDRAKYLLETYPQSSHQNDALAVLAAAYTHMGNATLAADAKRVLEQNDPNHPWLHGNWPKYPSKIRTLNPFSGG
jgi:outer membrane protein assembly factor BamD